MTPVELRTALRTLDKLYLRKDSFADWLSGDEEATRQYNELRQQIENAFPGFQVVRFDITYSSVHALVPESE